MASKDIKSKALAPVHVTSLGKKEPADVIDLKILKWRDYFRLSRRVLNSNKMVL